MQGHSCIDCAALPESERPKKPRPTPHGGPRSLRCATHYRAHRRGQKARNRNTYVAKKYGIDAEEYAELWEYQGERCICGRRPTRAPDVDHDHSCCSGPTSCGKCVRGALCRSCNTYVIGRYNAGQLRALADYIEYPTMARMRDEKRAA